MSQIKSTVGQPASGVFVIIAAVHVAVMAGIAVYLNFGGR